MNPTPLVLPPADLAPGCTIRKAVRDDLPALVELLHDDMLGQTRERHDDGAYLRGFEAVDADPAQFLAVVEDADGAVVGMMQLSLIPGISRGGRLRLNIEGVRISRSLRGQGVGSAMIGWATEVGRLNSAGLVQLTTDARRTDAQRFYARLGFVASHVGMKLELD
ncbi:GNAT family N-acetyltransferase [Arthrobacter sp. Y-9]|uniref:GNAT family N-acetyltransferase n=1 Tax=Arthrobacter sp. Y-9 TaxID=3039385 RepID=UPI00241C3481|nr:GNAT family N-acetyltransferase [Arthrobacter sp. Y-9]WFR85504.1 GNAT family N-acetyltransferase [Arthrobacter sp. Y-9]